MKATLLISLLLFVPALASAADGKTLYEVKCGVCHGAKGDGLGDAAYLLFPKPRDFTRGVYKFRSTSSGSLPTDQDLDRTVTNGLPGSSMPAWPRLTPEEKQAIITYIKGFSPEFKNQAAPEVMNLGTAPAVTKQLISQGRAVYERMQCRVCHGADGKGLGTQSQNLKDDFGLPIRAADFTRGHLKGGQRLEDVYRTIITGINGTPMPSFTDVLKPKENWALSAFILSLSKPVPITPIAERQVKVTRVDRVAMAYPDPIWDKAPVTRVPLKPLWASGHFADNAAVRAIANGRGIAFLLEWASARKDDNFMSVDAFSDGSAIQFPLEPTKGEPIYTMGERNLPVNIWHWKAAWQRELGVQRKLADVYPYMATDMAFMGLESTTPYLTAVAAGNRFSWPTRRYPVEDLNATGFSTLTTQPVEAQNIEGLGTFSDGKWQVHQTQPIGLSIETTSVKPRSSRCLPRETGS